MPAIALRRWTRLDVARRAYRVAVELQNEEALDRWAGVLRAEGVGSFRESDRRTHLAGGGSGSARLVAALPVRPRAKFAWSTMPFDRNVFKSRYSDEVVPYASPPVLIEDPEVEGFLVQTPSRLSRYGWHGRIQQTFEWSLPRVEQPPEKQHRAPELFRRVGSLCCGSSRPSFEIPLVSDRMIIGSRVARASAGR